MALNVKVGLIGLLDMLKFANLGKTRQQALEYGLIDKVIEKR